MMEYLNVVAIIVDQTTKQNLSATEKKALDEIRQFSRDTPECWQRPRVCLESRSVPRSTRLGSEPDRDLQNMSG